MPDVTVTPVFGDPMEDFEASNVFVMLPLREPFFDIFQNHILKISREMGLTCKHGGNFATAERIMDEVWSGIFYSDICIAECTGQNPNVFYEIGIAHTIGKPCILIAQSKDDLPFDVTDRRALIYDYDLKGMRVFDEKLSETLRFYASASVGVVKPSGNLSIRVLRRNPKSETESKHRAADLKLLKLMWESINTSNVLELNHSTQQQSLTREHLHVFGSYAFDRRNRPEYHFNYEKLEQAVTEFDLALDAYFNQLAHSSGMDADNNIVEPDYRLEMMDYETRKFKEQEWDKTIDCVLDVVKKHKQLVSFLKAEYPEFDITDSFTSK